MLDHSHIKWFQGFREFNRDVTTKLCPLILMAAFLWTGCATKTPAFSDQANAYNQTFYKPYGLPDCTYVLQFDENGLLVNFSTLLQAVRDIRGSLNPATSSFGGPITNIVVISYGWSHDSSVAEGDYYGFLTNYCDYLTANHLSLKPNTAIICIAWPSGASGLEEAVSDILPGQIGPVVASPLKLIFPLSVWSKASLANRIGYGDLPRSLNYLCQNSYTNDDPIATSTYRPNIYLVGHSFGCRILSGVIAGMPSPTVYLHPLATLQQELNTSTFLVSDITNWIAFTNDIQNWNKDEVSVRQFLSDNLQTSTQSQFTNNSSSLKLQNAVVSDLNRIIRSGPIYDTNRFAGVKLSPETTRLLGQKRVLQGSDLVLLNRMLLVDAFPDAISGSRFDSDQVVYDYNKYIKGAIFVEPAMTKDDLPSPNTCTNFPLLVTQSRHDHLNNLIFPIANIPYNTEYADDFDAFSSRYLTRPSNEQSNSFAARMSGIQGDIVGAVIGLPRFPLTVVESVLLWPPSWIYGQSIEIKKSGFSLRTNYLANTFAQLPVLDYPVREWLGDNSNYKGLFNLGVWNESASRISPTPPVSVASIVTSDNGLPFLNVPNGITYINAQEVIRRSIFNNPKFPRNIDYEKPSEDYTVGWVDPIGSHADYLPNPDVKDNPQIYSLFYMLIHDQRKNQNN